jgi:hypothetical protein
MSAAAVVQMPATHKDARPIIPRNKTNLWTRAEKTRDELYEMFSQACQSHGLEALLLHSGPYVFPAWVKFEAWQPQEDNATTERSSALITIDPKPYHEFEFEFAVTYQVKNKSRELKHVVPFGYDQVQELIAHLVNGGPKPRLSQFREHSLQFWRVKNKIQGLRLDSLAIWKGILIAAGFLAFMLFPVSIVFWIIAGFIHWRMRQRRWIVRNDGKPDGEPRTLIRVDSWQTVLFDLGSESAMVRDRFARALQTGVGQYQRFQPERVWYWGLDGKEEREQLVLTAGRAIVFCQIYEYGQDLYVGWDGNLNRGQWVEQTVASGIDKATGNPVGISRVVPGTQPTTEYDLADLSCLMEWTHAQIVKVLKQLIAEKKIDQEIDFSIQRAERRDVIASGAEAEGGIGKTLRKAFQRTG